MRKLLCSLTALVLLGLQTFAQDQCNGLGIEVEVVAEHNYPTGDPLEVLNGQTTYRLYVTTSLATDFVSAIAGDSENPVNINTSTSFFQEPTISVLTGDANNEAFYPAFPLQQYDSWVTIGRASASDAGGDINVVSGLTDWAGDFENGNNINISDAIGGSWFALNGDANGVAGDDLKVLLGQFTTDGDFSGNVYVQIFPNSVGANEYRCNLEFAYTAQEVPGCTDDAACNYDPAATVDDGSCELPNGCTDDLACNFDPNATCDDGSCIVVIAGELVGETDGTACSGDGASDVYSFVYETFGAEGTSTAWVVTDLAANILDIIPSTPMDWDMVDIDFEGYAAGEVLVWYITYTDLVGAALGANAADLTGCFDLSNPVSVEIAAAGCTDQTAINYNPDACGDDGSCEYDGEMCMVSCPEDIMIECSESTSADVTGMPTLTGNCSQAEVIMLDDEIEGDDCNYTITRTWNIMIPGGNAETCTQVITVTDMTGPEFIDFPEDVLVQCIEDVPAPVEVNAEDACNAVEEIEIFTSETGFPINECVASTAFGLGDDWAIWLPVLETSGVSLTDDFVPSGDLSFVQYNDGTAHASGTVVNNMNPNQGFIIDFWFENTVDWATWSAMGRSYKDDAGFAAAGGNLWTTWSYMEMVNGFSTLTGTGDFAGSVLYMNHMPSNYYFGFQCGEAANNKNANFGMSGWFTYTGILNGEAVTGHGDMNVDKECEPNNEIPCVNFDEYTYMYRATDSCGNATMDSYVVTVNDTTAPEFTVVPEDLVVECDMVPVPVFEGVEAIDNCDCGVTILPMVESEIEGDACNYSFTRTWGAIDCCGNRTDHIQTITVIDTVAPVFTYVPADATYECDVEFVLEDATAEDNCQEVQYSVSTETIEGDCPQEYTLVRTFTISDECNEPVTATQTITVVDTTAPSVNDYDVQTSADCEDVESVPGPIFEDNCGEVTVTVETQNQSGGCMGVLVRWYTAVDECGNTTTAEQYITILDNTPPVIVTPADMTVECDDVPAAPGVEGADVSDNCALEVDVTFNEEIIPGDCEDSYTIVWTWTAVDYCENMSEASTTITVVDTTNPVFVVVPEDLDLDCTEVVPGCDDQEVVAEDNCDTDLVIECTDNIIAGDCPQNYTIQRVYRAFDNCGNQGVYMQTINVSDTTAPEFEFVAEDVTIECDMEIPAADALAFDDCGEVSLEVTEEEVAGDCPQNYSIIRTYTAMDECGNMTTASQTVTIVDTTAPEFTFVPADLELECDQVVPVVNAEATDNCGAVTVTWTDSDPEMGQCPQEMFITRTFTAVDECGNTATATQSIHIVDTTAPVFDAYEIEVEAPCDNIMVPVLTATDNCSEVEVNYTDTPVSGGCAGRIIRDYTATDDCGNTATAQQIITLIDEVAPVFVDGPADLNVECDDVPSTSSTPTVEDNCDDEVEVTFLGEEIIAGDCPYNYTIVRTWSAIDHCDNEATYVQTINVSDTTAPEFEFVAESVTIECDETIPAADALAFDNCGEVSIEVTEEEVAGDCPQNYSIVRTYTATDECNNSSTATQTITIVDTTAPVFTAVADDVTIECDMDLPAPFATAEDNCGEVIITPVDEVLPTDCPQEYTVVRTYTAVDECGNAATATQTIVVVDTTAPVFEDYSIEVEAPCDDISAVELTATDNCDLDVTVTFIDTPVSGGCAGRIIRDYVATDCAGNSTTAQQIISLVDDVAPVFVEVPADMTYECGTEVADCSSEDVVVEDNCTEYTVSCSDEIVAGDCPQAYTILRTWVAIDACDNESSYTQTISIVDTTAPEFEFVAESVTIECDETIPAAEALAFDNCGEVSIDVTEEEVAGDCPQNYSIVRTYTAMDECGNAATATQTITIVDTTAPVFTEVAADVTIECDEAMPEPFATADDNCGEVSISVSGVSTPGECPQESVMVRTYTAMDECGNTATATQTITIVDTTAPVFTEVAADVTIECDEAMPEPFATAEDNCGDVTISVFGETTPGNCPQIYTMVRTYTAVDECGNSATATQTITVVDTTAPVFTFVPDEATYECDEEFVIGGAQAEDNCGETTVSFTTATADGDCPQASIITVTYTAVDECGNASTATQTINIVDTTAPVFTEVASDVTIECDEEMPAPFASADDNCGEVSISVNGVTTPGDCPQESVMVRTYTAVDECGNTATATQTITIVDTTAPEFTFVPFSNEVSCDQPLPTDVATATDNCGDVTITSEDAIIAGQCENNYEVVRTWTATDECGNASTATTSYYVYDATAPVFDGQPADISVECASDVPALVTPTATDNCSDVTVDCVEEIIEEDDCGNYIKVVTCTATDACGNSSSVNYTITVNDMTAPVLSGLPDANTVLDCQDEIPAAAEVTALDNCEGVVDVDFTEVLVGELPAEGSTADCLAVTPEAFENGELCTGEDPWSLKLFNFNGLASALYSTIEANWVEYPDGTATLTGSVVSNIDPNRGWNISVEFENGMDWADWSTQGFPTNYKDDCNESGDNHFDWTYYIMSAGATLTGWGSFDGATLNLAHAPSNYYYGYQVGVAANNVNLNYGSGGWFTYSGLFNGTEVMGSGDFAFDHDCCPRYSIERTWCAMDCSGNETCFTQLISFEDLDGINPIAGDGMEAMVFEPKGDFQITRIAPNPTVDRTMIEYYSSTNNTVELAVFDMSGRQVAVLFQGTISKGETYRTDYGTSALESGMYTVRLASENHADYQKLVVTK